MIQFSNGGAHFFIGKTITKENQTGAILGGIAGAQYVDAAAKAYGVPVILNTDHCAKKLLPWVDGLLAASEEHVRQDRQTALQLAHARPLRGAVGREPRDQFEVLSSACRRWASRLRSSRASPAARKTAWTIPA